MTKSSVQKNDNESTRMFTCIVCPNGCEISVRIRDGKVISISGASCKKGEAYVEQEITCPIRTISSSVRVRGGELPLVSVRLDNPVPKERIFDVMEEIKKVSVDAPTKIGDCVIKNVLGLGSDVIITKNVRKAEPEFKGPEQAGSSSGMLEKTALAGSSLFNTEWQSLVERWIQENPPGKKVLLIPPDLTRAYSYAGEICVYLYQRLQGEHDVYLMPAVGSHQQLTRSEQEAFFPGVPADAFLTHDWLKDCVTLGVVPKDYVRQVSKNLYQEDIQVQIDRRLTDGSFDTIVSVGQVVPHEIVGMANYTKNLLIGVGGPDMINKSHMVGALYGVENIMGNTDTPVRAIFDYAQREYLDKYGITFFLTVTTEDQGKTRLHGLFIGQGRNTFEAAANLASQYNITYLDERQKKIVAYLEPEEFKSFWVGNKAVYRTRMAIADGGELLVIAPGIKEAGEQPDIDAQIRKYGYCGTEKVLQLYKSGVFDGKEMIAAHLIHGSNEGRFRVTFATDPALMPKEEVENLGFSWMDVKAALRKYQPIKRSTGFVDDESGQYYFVKAPSTGLWRTR